MKASFVLQIFMVHAFVSASAFAQTPAPEPGTPATIVRGLVPRGAAYGTALALRQGRTNRQSAIGQSGNVNLAIGQCGSAMGNRQWANG
jgi:hypothetical protein